LKYFKRYWEETTGDGLTDSWGTSYYYFETDDQLNVLRQLQVSENGQILKYDTEYLEDKFGGLSEVLLDEEFEPFEIDKAEFEQVWLSSSYKQFPEIVITGDTLWGQPRLEGRRLAVGDIVSHADVNNSAFEAAKDYEITLQQTRQALHYCRTLQCLKDNPILFCHNCTLRVQQEGKLMVKNRTTGKEQTDFTKNTLCKKEG